MHGEPVYSALDRCASTAQDSKNGARWIPEYTACHPAFSSRIKHTLLDPLAGLCLLGKETEISENLWCVGAFLYTTHNLLRRRQTSSEFSRVLQSFLLVAIHFVLA
jgi:hypothetical protein